MLESFSFLDIHIWEFARYIGSDTREFYLEKKKIKKYKRVSKASTFVILTTPIYFNTLGLILYKYIDKKNV